ncbi:hypothetical protein HK097_002650 [Rhizophlyctis rosea]|uniref:Chitin deacetylase n=1 Tax=Rhizophlyctis rosea TaxID=64517 RepID=A0AAD5S5R6_9FUNG|nr:hypothetical protein HK097_002650 [Rhizophlyctis rosea]
MRYAHLDFAALPSAIAGQRPITAASVNAKPNGALGVTLKPPAGPPLPKRPSFPSGTVYVGNNKKCGPSNNGAVCSANLCCAYPLNTADHYCGSTAKHCGVGRCNGQFGSCWANGTVTATATTRTTTKTTTKTTTTSSAPAATRTAVSGDKCGVISGITWKCPIGECCSQYNYCGTTTAHCGTGCRTSFGQCGTSSPPTSSGPAKVIERCTQAGTMAVTFDDGPFEYTQSLINQFNAAGFKTTLFVNGNNWGCIYSYASALRSAFQSGHQIASHTWSHSHLPEISQSTLESEFTKVDAALKNIIGRSPTYFRPPFGESNSNVLATAGNFGYTKSILWSVDSFDYEEGRSMAQKQATYENLDRSIKHIALNHDVHETTVTQLVPYILKWAKDNGVKLVTVGECLGEASSKWYKDVGSFPASSPNLSC